MDVRGVTGLTPGTRQTRHTKRKYLQGKGHGSERCFADGIWGKREEAKEELNGELGIVQRKRMKVNFQVQVCSPSELVDEVPEEEGPGRIVTRGENVAREIAVHGRQIRARVVAVHDPALH